MFQSEQDTQQKHSTPKCTSCGMVTQWKVGPILRPIDWVIAIVLFFFFGTGLIYLLIVFVIRSNPNNREKICPNCGARNMWTFVY
jgi:hypothetical protein